MKRSDLLRSAGDFTSLPPAVVAEYEAKRERLVARINQQMLERPDIDALVGTDNRQMMKDNHANHALFMASILSNYHPDVMVTTVLWVFRAYRSRNFHPNYWAAQLNAWVAILEAELSTESAAAILPIYHWMIVNIPQFTALTETEDGSAAG